jgi:hypothetical protein
MEMNPKCQGGLMLELTDKAKDQLHRDLYLVNSEIAKKQLARDIMEKLKAKRKEVRNVSEKDDRGV